MVALIPKKILITGGSGFLGGRLASFFHDLGHDVCVCTRSAAINNLPQKIRVRAVDWNSVEELTEVCIDKDVVIHAAGMNSGDCVLDPVAGLEFNGVGTGRLVEAVRLAKVGQMIYLSTAHVYSRTMEGCISEATYPRNLHPYATSKLAGENMVRSLNIDSRLVGLVVRLSNAFGSPVNQEADCWNLLVNGLCREAIESKQLTLLTGGKQLRDFIPVTLVCEQLAYVIFERWEYLDGDILNIGSGTSRSTQDMALLVGNRCQKVLGYSPELRTSDYFEDIASQGFSYSSLKLPPLFAQPDFGSRFVGEIDELLSFCSLNFNQL